MTIFLCHFEQNGATTNLFKIAGRNRIFSPLRIEAKLIENLLPLGLEDDELHFNKQPEYALILIIQIKFCEPSCTLFVTMTHS